MRRMYYRTGDAIAAIYVLLGGPPGGTHATQALSRPLIVAISQRFLSMYANSNDESKMNPHVWILIRNEKRIHSLLNLVSNASRGRVCLRTVATETTRLATRNHVSNFMLQATGPG